MRVGPFQGIRSVLEVECSGAGLQADAKLVSLTLRQSYEDKFLASVNLVNNECTTSDSFSSCELNKQDDRKTKVKTLVMDLQAGEERKFSCDVNNLRSRGRSDVTTLSLVVKGRSEYIYVVYVSTFTLRHFRLLFSQ